MRSRDQEPSSTTGAAMDGERIVYRCSFCDKDQSGTDRLFAGPDGAFICEECVILCGEIFTEERQIKKRAKGRPRRWPQLWPR
ncbi:MAG: ClpX C4-type zinc finger protein [Chloroflexota bacterium]